MTVTVRRLIVASALLVPALVLACSKSADAPRIPSIGVSALGGDGQVGLAGWRMNAQPLIKAADSLGNVIAGATVTFAVTGGGGSATGLTATTDANGFAQVGSWVLGSTPGVNTMSATVSKTGYATGSRTFADTGLAAGYTITIQQYGPTMKPQLLAAFDSAVAKWQRIIYRPLTSVAVTAAAGLCAPNTPAVNQTTTGLIILAAMDSIDGPSKTLAESYPCLARNSSGLTVLGVMLFDSADVQTMITNGTLMSVVVHEMGHVLGFGSLWGPPSPPVQANCIFLQDSGGVTRDTYFGCPKARAAFDSAGGLNYTGGGSSPPAGNKVPVENCGTSPYVAPNCGAGTVNSHWREVVFGNELMTGFINAGANPLSVVTIAAMEDIKYTVNYAAADAYAHGFTAPPAEHGAPPMWLGNDVPRKPIYFVNERGVVVRVVQPR